MQISYKTTIHEETQTFLIYKYVHIKEEIKSAYLVFETSCAKECTSVFATLNKQLEK